MKDRPEPGRLIVAAMAVLLTATALPAQPLSQRIEEVRRQREAEKAAKAAEAEAAEQAAVNRLADRIAAVQIENVTAARAVQWWSDTMQIPVLVNWTLMEQEGVSADTVVEVRGANLPAGVVLALILEQASPDQPLMFEVSGQLVKIMTRAQANRAPIVRVYDVRDLLVATPMFTGAPNLNIAANAGTTGGASGRSVGGTSAGSLSVTSTERRVARTPEERAEALAQLIKDTVEPDFWREHDGGHGSIKYLRGNLVIRAPLYVHQKIGREAPLGASWRAMVDGNGGLGPALERARRGELPPSPPSSPSAGSSRSSVSGIQESPVRRNVSGVQEER